MRRVAVFALVSGLLLSGGARAQGWAEMFRGLFGGPPQSEAVDGLMAMEILAGLREALAQGTTAAVNQLGRTDGFWADAARRIPPPPLVSSSATTLRALGFGAALDAFHLTLNRAAEQAVPQAADVLGDAVRQMSVADARSILEGGNDAATRYFERVSGPALRERFMPLVAQATAQVGVTRQYRALTERAGPMLQASGLGTAVDLDAYVADQALQQLFAVMAEEERRIRQNPAARTTEVLQRVFGRQP